MQTIDTALLVNPHRIRDSVRRLFDGTPARIVGELLQNSQRAGATAVAITTTSTGFSYEDNGHGIEGVEGFYKLLCLGDSNFSEQVELDQSPMGLGFASLLANEQVIFVTIQSRGSSVSIDCLRWWQDVAYYSTWAERLESGREFAGFRIEVNCCSKFIELLRKCLPLLAVSIRWRWQDELRSFPALGYQNLLEVELDEQSVYTGLPLEFVDAELLTRFEWEGAKVRVFSFINRYQDLQIINWYGQLIPAPMGIPFSFIVTVRSGSPLTPKAPVRDSLVENEAKSRLKQAIVDAIFQELCSLSSSKTTTHNIKALYELDFQRAGRECPYFLASAHPSYESGQYLSQIDDVEPSSVYRYDSPPTLVDDELGVILSDDPEAEIPTYECGIISFVDCLKAAGITPHRLNTGSVKRLDIQELFWRPGSAKTKANERTNTEWFYGRGYWAIGEEIENLTWNEVTTDVFAFSECSSWSIDYVDWVIGTKEEMPITTLEQIYLAGFEPDCDESDYDTRLGEYEESLNAVVRLLLDDAVPRDADYLILRRHAGRRINQPDHLITNFKAEFNTAEGNCMTLADIVLIGRSPAGDFKLKAKIYG